MTQKLKIEDGPDPADLRARISDKENGLVVPFDAEGEMCEAGVEEIEGADANGTCWRIRGTLRSGKLKGRRFSGNYNAQTRKGLFDVGRVEIAA